MSTGTTRWRGTSSRSWVAGRYSNAEASAQAFDLMVADRYENGRRLGQATGTGHASGVAVQHIYAVDRHHGQHAVVAADADRGRAAGQMGVEGVVAQIGAGIDARLDQQVHVRAPVAGEQCLRA